MRIAQRRKLSVLFLVVVAVLVVAPAAVNREAWFVSAGGGLLLAAPLCQRSCRLLIARDVARA